MNLPDEYIPKSLRKIDQPPPNKNTIYAIGHTDDMKSFGMSDGPTENLDQMLETVPQIYENKITVLIAFAGNNDNWKGDKVLYFWNNNRWKRVK